MTEPFMITFTGGRVRIRGLDPERDAADSNSDIQLMDIATHLSRQCRYNGATLRPYTVAEHSVFVYAMVKSLPGSTRNERAWALLHDAAEAYIGDIISPVKNLLGDRIHQIERAFEDAIARRFGLEGPIPECVRIADRDALQCEMAHLLAGPPKVGVAGDPWTLRYNWPAAAPPLHFRNGGRDMFLHLADELLLPD